MQPAAPDDTYTLYLDGDPATPWSAYCAGMASTPREYLTLTGMNFSQYTAGFFGGTDVRTTYSKVRFVPASHKIDITDRSFAPSQGQLRHPSSTTEELEVVTSMPYGVAMDCSGEGSSTGLAQIDLSGTRFALIGSQQFTMNGGEPGGSVALSSNNQRATLRGGGLCGWTAPAGAPPEPINDHVTAGALLELVYRR